MPTDTRAERSNTRRVHCQSSLNESVQIVDVCRFFDRDECSKEGELIGGTRSPSSTDRRPAVVGPIDSWMTPAVVDEREHPEFAQVEQMFTDIQKFLLQDISALLSERNDDLPPSSTLTMVVDQIPRASADLLDRLGSFSEGSDRRSVPSRSRLKSTIGQLNLH